MSTIVSSWMAGVLAQAQPPSAVSEAVQVQSVWDFVVKGGPMMIPLGLCSLLALAVIVERLISLRRSRIIPQAFLDKLKGTLDNGTDRRKSLELCRANNSPIANILAAAVKQLGKPVEAVEKHVQAAGERETVRLRKYLRLLAVIAAITPLMGLLGTIFGMIEAFQTVAISGEALGKTELMAKGIYEAMITTAAGLLIAIPVLVSYHWISARIDRLVLEMDQLILEFIEEHGDGPTREPYPESAERSLAVAAS